MSDFLRAFADRVIVGLLAEDLVEIEAGTEAEVVDFVTAALVAAKPGASVISSTAAALIACPQVIDLFADDVALKAVVDGLAPGAA